MPSITFLIPALNEEKRIGATLTTVLGVLAQRPGLTAQVLVIDDGSRDGTAAVVAGYAARHPEVMLVRHEVNRGLGQAFRTGLAHATGEKLLIVPGDNDLPAATIAQLLASIDRADLVMCYFPDRAQRGPGRRLLSGAFGGIYRVLFGIEVEYINGPSIYPVAKLRELELTSTRFSIVAETNVKLLRQGPTYCEIPSHRQTGMAGSTSLSFRNLRETARVLAHLCWEIHVRRPARYLGRARRVAP